MASWKLELKNSFRTAEDLARQGFIFQRELGDYRKLISKFPFFLTPYFASLIDKKNPKCPIRLQAIPSLEEFDNKGFLDPLSDLKHQPVVGVTHRYSNRLLVHLTSLCSMYCRYCFRKSLLNELKGEFFGKNFSQILEYLKKHLEVNEVIFSGGDPLMVSDPTLLSAIKALETLTHIKRLRFHTRVPVTLPSRINSSFIKIIKTSSKKIIWVTHFNHPKEITFLAKKALTKLAKTGLLLNQSVLLKNINDDPAILIDLSEKLFDAGNLPYYLHHTDLTAGTSHFALSYEKGKKIYHEVRKKLPGFLVPKYVVDLLDSDYKKNVSEMV